jgi:hypothetical protein
LSYALDEMIPDQARDRHRHGLGVGSSNRAAFDRPLMAINSFTSLSRQKRAKRDIFIEETAR